MPKKKNVQYKAGLSARKRKKHIPSPNATKTNEASDTTSARYA